MSMKKAGIVLFLILSFFPLSKASAQVKNAGFVAGNIWYSQDPFEEGDKVKIYTIVFNSDSRQLSGTVIFFDSSTFLGKKDFVVEGKGFKDVSIDWTVNAGEHLIFGKIENSKFLLSNGTYEEVYLMGNKTEESSRAVDKKIIISPGNPSGTTINSIISDVGDAGLDSVINLGKKIEENTPEVITRPLTTTGNFIEAFRKSAGLSSKNKKEEVKKEIEALNDKGKTKPKVPTSTFLKPVKYTELLALTFLSTTLNSKYIFYGSIALLFLLLLRYVAKRVI